MNYTTYRSCAEFEIKKDEEGWLVVRKTKPFFSIRYIEQEDMFQLILLAFNKMPKGFQFEVSKATAALKKAMTKVVIKEHTEQEELA